MTIINPLVYYAAHAGAISGMAISGWIIDPTKQDYSQVVGIAGAFAQAFDQAWDQAAAPSVFEAEAITAVVESDFRQRGPGPLAYGQYSNSENWAVAATACVALILESDAFLASQGLTPPSSYPNGTLLSTAYAQANNVLLPFAPTNPTDVVTVTGVNVPANCKVIAHFDGVFEAANQSDMATDNYTIGYSIGRGTHEDTYQRLVNLVPFGTSPGGGVYVPFKYVYEYATGAVIGTSLSFSGLALIVTDTTVSYNVYASAASLLIEVVSV
jgi:hypothetical protein